MIISDNGLRLIAEFEGYVGHLYNDPVGHCTIGYGFLVHLGPCDGRASEDPFKNGITHAEGVRLLNDTVEVYADAVDRYTTATINQNQFDALTSLCYNIGVGGYRSSTVLSVLNRGYYHEVCTELHKYIHGTDGVVYPGLVRRREAECDLFNAPMSTIGEENETMLEARMQAAGIFFEVAVKLEMGLVIPAKVKAKTTYLLGGANPRTASNTTLLIRLYDYAGARALRGEPVDDDTIRRLRCVL